MISNATVLSWIVLSPFAILTDVAAICFVCHYKPFYHGSDIMIISLLVAMAMNALLVVPIPAFTEFGYFHWNSVLCKFYVWTFVTFRIAQMLTLSAICFHWSAIFKASSNNQNKGLTYRIKFVSVIIWILSSIIGLIPIIGAVPDEFFGEDSCMFLTSDMGIGFTIFIFIFVITCMFLAIISICDVTFLTKCMKKTASVRYGAGRFYIPKKRSDVPGNGSYNAQEKFNQLNFTWDLCRLFCIVIFFCFIGNHLPFAVSILLFFFKYTFKWLSGGLGSDVFCMLQDGGEFHSCIICLPTYIEWRKEIGWSNIPRIRCNTRTDKLINKPSIFFF